MSSNTMTTGFEGLPSWATVHSIDPESCVIIKVDVSEDREASEVDAVAKAAGFRFENHGRGPTLDTELWLYTPAVSS